MHNSKQDLTWSFELQSKHSNTKSRYVMRLDAEDDLRIWVNGHEAENVMGVEQDVRSLVFGTHKNFIITGLSEERHEKLRKLFIAREL